MWAASPSVFGSSMASAVAATAKCGDPKYFPKAPGAFKRGRSHIMNWIEDGTEFPPEAGRYHLVLNFSCGWCARLLIARELKGLQEVVSVSHTKVKIERPDGWPIEPWDAVSRSAGWKSIRDVYNWDAGGYGDGSERYGKRQLAVPVLLDLRSKRVVSNDSAQILLMLNGAFEPFSNGVELYPEHLQADIEAINDVVRSAASPLSFAPRSNRRRSTRRSATASTGASSPPRTRPTRRPTRRSTRPSPSWMTRWKKTAALIFAARP